MSCEVAFESNEVSGELRKNSRISYSRDCLLSFAEVDFTKALPTGFDRSILSEMDNVFLSVPERHVLPDLESLSTGRIWGESSRGSSEKWGSCKLSSKDCKPIDAGTFHSNQAHHSWLKPESNAILTSVPKLEHDGILGSWSTSKLPSSGSEASVLKLPGIESGLLSRCNDPYRPPSFYKAMNHSGKPNRAISSNGKSECTDCPSKARSVEGNWRRDSCLVLEEHLAAPEVTTKKHPSPISPSVSGSVESLCSIGEASEKCRKEETPDHHSLTQDPMVQQFPSKSQLIGTNSGMAIDKEQLQPFHDQILKGGRFSALMDLEEAEDIDAYFLDEKYDVMMDGRNSRHWFPDNDNYDSNISSEADRDGRKVWGEPTGKAMKENPLGQWKSKEASTYGQKAPFSEKIKTCVADCLDPDSVVLNYCYPDHNIHDSQIVKEPVLDKVADEADLSLELNLPDEDSLIDGIYIFEQEQPNDTPEIPIRNGRSVSPFHGSNKVTKSESVQPKSTLPDPQLHESQKNSKNPFVHPSDPLAHVNTPPTILDPRKNHYNPIPFVPPPFGQLPLKPNYDFVENLRSPRMPNPDDYCPDLDKILSADPSIYHQFFQSPSPKHEPNVLRSLLVMYNDDAYSSTDPQRNENQGGDGNNMIPREEGIFEESCGSNVLGAVEPGPGAPGPGLGPHPMWHLVPIFSVVIYEHYLQMHQKMAMIEMIQTNDLQSWQQLEDRLRVIYERNADVNVLDMSPWPGRIIHYYCGIGMIERFPLVDDWDQANVAQDLDSIYLDVGWMFCQIVLFDQNHEQLLGEIDAMAVESWFAMAHEVRQIFLAHFPLLNVEAEVINPVSCCPGAFVTYWTNLNEKLLWSSDVNQENYYYEDNWSYVQRVLYKVRIRF